MKYFMGLVFLYEKAKNESFFLISIQKRDHFVGRTGVRWRDESISICAQFQLPSHWSGVCKQWKCGRMFNALLVSELRNVEEIVRETGISDTCFGEVDSELLLLFRVFNRYCCRTNCFCNAKCATFLLYNLTFFFIFYYFF